DETRVFVTIADNQAARLVLQRQANEELAFAAYFQSEIVGFACVQNLFHHFAQLIDLDRKNAAIFALITELADGILKGAINRFHTMTENILKPNEERKFEPASFRLLNDIGQVHRSTRILQGRGDDMACFVDVKIPGAPAVDIIEVTSTLDVPRFARVGNITHLAV